MAPAKYCETINLRRLGILTGGGDCPGLNAVIRAIAKTAMTCFGVTVIGIEDGFEGLIEGHMHQLSNLDVSGILSLGGTILGTSNKGDPFHYPVVETDQEVRSSTLPSRLYKIIKTGISTLWSLLAETAPCTSARSFMN